MFEDWVEPEDQAVVGTCLHRTDMLLFSAQRCRSYHCFYWPWNLITPWKWKPLSTAVFCVFGDREHEVAEGPKDPRGNQEKRSADFLNTAHQLVSMGDFTYAVSFASSVCVLHLIIGSLRKWWAPRFSWREGKKNSCSRYALELVNWLADRWLCHFRAPKGHKEGMESLDLKEQMWVMKSQKSGMKLELSLS